MGKDFPLIAFAIHAHVYHFDANLKYGFCHAAAHIKLFYGLLHKRNECIDDFLLV
jgi:hypothetical protein